MNTFSLGISVQWARVSKVLKLTNIIIERKTIHLGWNIIFYNEIIKRALYL